MLSLFFGFNGRINRLQYWLGNILVGVVGCFALFMGIMLAGLQAGDKSSESMMRVLSTMGLTLAPVLMVMSWASLALQVKRFHDRGRSGLFTMLPLLPVIMIAVTIMGGAASGQPVQQVAAQCQLYINILFLINLGFFIDLGCLPGKDGPNRYGNPPAGGFSIGGGGAPAAAATFAAPAAPASGGLAFLGSVDKAMERAIAEQQKPQPAAPAPMAAPRPAVARAAVAAGPASFGRKPAR